MHAVAIDVRDGLGAGRLDVEQVERLEAVRAAPVTALVPDAAPREIPSVPIYEADDVPRAVPKVAVYGPEIRPAAVDIHIDPAIKAVISEVAQLAAFQGRVRPIESQTVQPHRALVAEAGGVGADVDTFLRLILTAVIAHGQPIT